jgi:hypothetical protein
MSRLAERLNRWLTPRQPDPAESGKAEFDPSNERAVIAETLLV